MVTKYTVNIEEVKNLIKLGKSRQEMAEVLNCSIHKIKRFLSNNNIRMTSHQIVNYRDNLIDNKDDILKLYESCNRLEVVAQKYKCNQDVIRQFFRSINYKYKTNNNINLSEHLDEIKDYYYTQFKNLSEISKLYNCSSVKIKDFMISSGCILRNKRDISSDLCKSDVFQRKLRSSSGRLKDYTLPSGSIIRLRGYEPQFLDHVFNNNILNETQIEFQPKRIPYIHDAVSHFYYPDFHIPKYNLIIEIKSKWILEKQGPDKNISKKQYTNKAGYNFIMILNNDFKEFEQFISNS